MQISPILWLAAAVGFLALEANTFNMTSIWFAIGSAAALLCCVFTGSFRVQAVDALVTLDAVLYALLYIFGLAFAFYPLTRWCKQNEGFSWPWPHVQSEKKRIKELRREQQAQENEEKGEK